MSAAEFESYARRRSEFAYLFPHDSSHAGRRSEAQHKDTLCPSIDDHAPPPSSHAKSKASKAQ